MILNILLSPIKDKKNDEDSMEINEKDYRKIDKISYTEQPTPLMCGQACVAMVVDVNIEDVAKTMGTSGPTSIGQIIYALDYYKIRHGEKN